MSGFASALWWFAYTIFAMVIQMLLPHIDAFVGAFILLLQERSYKSLLWFLPFVILLQEGLGTRPFGGSIVWYVSIASFFYIGERFFSSHTSLFVLFLSSAIGAAYYGITLLLAPLQNLDVNTHALLDSSLVQTVVIVATWMLVRRFRPRVEQELE